MPVFLLNEELHFPDPREANVDGVLAIGGDLRPDRLLFAYEIGVFPWYNPPEPVIWWSPNPRCVLYTDELRVSKSMRNVFNQKKFSITYDEAFREVIEGCRDAPRSHQDGTWISSEIIDSFTWLHKLGVAHSVEVWESGKLVGGLYGISLGRMFFGESMFSLVSNASKAGFIHLVHTLNKMDFKLVDCQIYNDHLGRLGATEIPRDNFLMELDEALKKDTIQGNWAHLAREYGKPYA